MGGSEEDALCTSLALTTYDADGAVVGRRCQTLPLVYPDFARSGPERVKAVLEGWLLAVPALLDRAPELDAEPTRMVCPPAQHDPRARTATEYRDLIFQPDGPWQAWTGDDWETALDAELLDKMRDYVREKIEDGEHDDFQIILAVQSMFWEHDVDARITVAARAIAEAQFAGDAATPRTG